MARGSLWLTIAQVSPLAVNITLTPYVITQLGETQYGLWLIASSVALFMGQFDAGVYRTALRLFSIEGAPDGVPRRLVTSLSLGMIGLSCVTLLPLVLLPDAVTSFFHVPSSAVPDTRLLLRVMAMVVAVALARGVYVAVLHSRFRFGLTAVSTIAGYAAYAVAMFTTLHAGWGLRGVAIAYVVQTFVTTIFIVPAALRLIDRRGPRLMRPDELLTFARIAWRVQTANLLTALPMQGSLLLVGRAEPRQVSDFGPGSTFAQNFRSLPLNALGPVQARLAGAIGRDEAGSATVYDRLQRYWAGGIAGMFV